MRGLMFFTATIFIATLGFSCGAGMTIAGGNVQRNVIIGSYNTTSHAATVSSYGDGVVMGLVVAGGVLVALTMLLAWVANRGH